MVKRTLLTLLAAGGLALAGCDLKPQPKAWTEDDLQKHFSPAISVPTGWGAGNSNEMYLEDMDGDGKADYIHFARQTRFIAEGYMEKLKNSEERVIREENTPVMTPKMREAATRAMNAQRDFAREYLKSQGLYKEK